MQLNIISQRPDFMGRKLCQYTIDSVNTIGVYGNEPFSISFHNSSPKKVQIKLSLDGTDILTGQVADLDPSSKMWVVNPRGRTELKAWPESHQGGAAFVFSTVENSVAAHTHGDLTAKGFISCAVFVEGYAPPVYNPPALTTDDYYPKTLSATRGGERSFSLNDGPAIGAGTYQQQLIRSASGLIQPVFSHILQVRYLWWDDLVQRLQEAGIQPLSQHPTGFHGGISLGDTPRIGEPLIAHAYSRFAV